MSDRALEAFENAGLISRQYAASAIFDTDCGDIAGRGQGQQNGSSAAVFDRIGDEVVQDLLDREAVEKNRKSIGCIDFEGGAGIPSRGQERLGGFAKLFCKIEILGMDR